VTTRRIILPTPRLLVIARSPCEEVKGFAFVPVDRGFSRGALFLRSAHIAHDFFGK
jgi:hypothetical protein